MSRLQEGLGIALDEFLAEAGETITQGSQSYTAIVSTESFGSEFIPGMELGNREVRARVSKREMSAAPALQTEFTVRTKTMRLIRVQPNGFSFLLIFEDPTN
jgi:hypothetical protein